MRAKKVYEFERVKNPYYAMEIGSLSVLKKFLAEPWEYSKKYDDEWLRGLSKENLAKQLGVKINGNNDIEVLPFNMANHWYHYPDTVKQLLKERIPNKLPNLIKSNEELMDQIHKAVKILEKRGFKILNIPKHAKGVNATIKIKWTYTSPANPQSKIFTIFKSGYVRWNTPIFKKDPMLTYQELAQKLIDKVDKHEKQFAKRLNRGLNSLQDWNDGDVFLLKEPIIRRHDDSYIASDHKYEYIEHSVDRLIGTRIKFVVKTDEHGRKYLKSTRYVIPHKFVEKYKKLFKKIT